MRSFFKRLKEGLTKTQKALAGQIKEALGLSPSIDDALFEQIETVLIGADCGVGVAEELVARLKKRCSQERVTESAAVLGLIKDEMKSILSSGLLPEQSLAARDPIVTIFVGVNGVGKTTSIGKIGCHYTQAGQRVSFAAADTFRAAAGEQLEIWAERAGAQLVGSSPGGDPAAVAFDAVQAAKARGINHVLIDTAGRLHSKSNLMAELAKIRRSVDKALGPQCGIVEVLLVMDATTGQNGLAQAAEFTRVAGVSGIVLTKLDGTAKGGIVLAIAHQLRIPVRWVGIGEAIDDLETFDPDEFVQALFD
jgi:fused signal recognition particle receptor